MLQPATMGKVLSLASFRDGYANLMSRLGMGQDRNTASAYFVAPLSQQQIEAAYRSSWLTRKVHDLVPFEMTRAGRAWQAEADQIEKLETAETALQLWHKLRAALTTARLHGGAALVLGVRQGQPSTALNVETITANSLRYVFVASRHQLTAPQGFDIDPESDFFGQPSMWEMRGARGNSVQIHPSRVIPFHGAPLPPGSVTMSQLDQFWGDPLLISIKSAIDNAETSQAAVATLLHEMKQDVISIPGLTELMATAEGEELLAKRIRMISELKSLFNALLLDGGDGGENGGGEVWETRQLSFAQHPELLRSFVGIVAGAADIPVTRLMGESPGGLQSTGKGEQDDFNRMISAKQTADLAGPLARLDEVLIRSTLGTRPPEIYYEFGALAESDPKQAADIEKLEAETVQIYVNTNLIPADALGKAAANRLKESGRWPGLDTALEESEQELGEAKLAAAEAALNPPDPPVAANENDVRQMEKRETVTRDQALILLADASPRTLRVTRDVTDRAGIDAWAAEEKIGPLVGKLRVVIFESRLPVDWMKAGSYDWGDDDGTLTIGEGGPRIVERDGEGNTVLLFSSSRLGWRQRELARVALPSAVYEYESLGDGDYQPALVLVAAARGEAPDLRTVKPYRGKLALGPEIFEEMDSAWLPPMGA